MSGAGLGCATTASPAETMVLSTDGVAESKVKQMHSTTAQPSSRQRACPYQPSCAAPFTGGATLDGHRVPDAVPELAPAWKRYPRLASEMHCTTAHRLISHIYTARSPAKPAEFVDSSNLTPPFSPPGRAMSKPTCGQMPIFGGQASTSCGAADSSGMQRNLVWRP